MNLVIPVYAPKPFFEFSDPQTIRLSLPETGPIYLLTLTSFHLTDSGSLRLEAINSFASFLYPPLHPETIEARELITTNFRKNFIYTTT